MKRCQKKKGGGRGRGKEREREDGRKGGRERERERVRGTDRQRQTDRQTEAEAERQRERERVRERETIQAMEMMCCHKILRISYKDRVTNEEVRGKVQQAIGPREDLLTTVKRRRLQWYGHVSRSSGPAKTILRGTVKGGRSQGRERKRWENNIREWTVLEFAKSQRAVENRGK